MAIVATTRLHRFVCRRRLLHRLRRRACSHHHRRRRLHHHRGQISGTTITCLQVFVGGCETTTRLLPLASWQVVRVIELRRSVPGAAICFRGLMTADKSLVCVGAIAGAHGVRGEVRVRSFTLYPEDCFAYGPLRKADGDILLTPRTARPAKNHFVVEAVEELTREDWEALKGEKLYVPRAELPEPEEDEFYYDDLLGLKVVHVDGRALGKVKSVQNFGADDLLELIAPDNRTAYYLPFTKAVIPVVRLAERELLAEPEETYLPEDIQVQDPENED